MGLIPEVDRTNPVKQQAVNETLFVFRVNHEGPRAGARGKPSERACDHVAELHQQTLVVAASAFGYGRVDQTRKQKPGRAGRRTIEVSQRIDDSSRDRPRGGRA